MGKHYTKEIKLEAVRLFEKGKTHKEITETLGIRDPQRTKKWIRAYREKGVEAYQASHGIYGYRRIALWLRQRKGRVINHKAVLRLMKKLGIQSRARRRKAYRKLEELGT